MFSSLGQSISANTKSATCSTQWHAAERPRPPRDRAGVQQGPQCPRAGRRTAIADRAAIDGSLTALVDVAEAIVRCTTGGELLREVGAVG